MNQTEIDELRRLASVSREPRHGIGCIASDCALASAARNALPRLLAALEEARAERGMLKKSLRLLDRITDGREQSNGTDPEEIQIVVERFHALKAERDEWEGRAKERAKTQLLTACDLKDAKTERDALKEKLAAMDLLLNNAERVVRDGIADRDAAESLAWDALGRPEGTHDTTNVQRLCEAHGALKAKLADAEAERGEARSLLLNGIQTNGDSLAFLEHVRREHAKRAESERAWCELATERGAKLEALVEAVEGIDPWPHSDEGPVCHSYWGKPCNCLAQPNRDAISAAIAAAKVQP